MPMVNDLHWRKRRCAPSFMPICSIIRCGSRKFITACLNLPQPSLKSAPALGDLERWKLIARAGEWWAPFRPRRDYQRALRRAAYTRKLWHNNAWVLRLICRFPFVKGVAITGAGAFENCRPAPLSVQGETKVLSGANDIDLFIIAQETRLWLTYAALILVLKALGKRKADLFELYDQQSRSGNP